MKKRIAVIGGGASGLMAAISAAKYAESINKASNLEVVIVEKSNRVARKILATGNGRCNITNENITLDRYHGNDKDFIKTVFRNFSMKNTLDFFHDIGLLLRFEDEGRVYPFSEQASSVVDTLRIKLNELGIREICDFNVTHIDKQDKKFRLMDDSGKNIICDSLIVCCGGMASPKLGSDGSGYKLLKMLGHRIVKTGIFPSLVQIKTDTTYTKALKGIKFKGSATLKINNINIKQEFGEILFTDYGLSGIAIMQLSRMVSEFINGISVKKMKKVSKDSAVISLDFMPGYDFDMLVDYLSSRRKKQLNRTLEDFFSGILNKRIAQTIIKFSGFKLSTLVRDLSVSQIKKLANTMKNFTLPCIGTMNFNNAQVTAGGIDTKDFYPETLESKLEQGLYAAGEILDVDGDCGGFNLQWAWSSGFIAGKSCALKLLSA